MDIDVGNVSTIATMVWGVIISPILVSYGVVIDNAVGTAVISGLILLVLLIWSACNPNSLGVFGNKKDEPPIDDGILNDEYVTGDQGQSRAIERLDAELSYKKEKLDDLKADNRRMEEKIDEIKEDINELMLKSKTDDDKIENRLTAIETEQKVMREQSNKKIAIIGVILAVLTFYFNYIK